jgi:hypothetical protein
MNRTDWGRTLREAGYDPNKDWRKWNHVMALADKANGLLTQKEYDTLFDALEDPNMTQHQFEQIHLRVYVYLDPSERTGERPAKSWRNTARPAPANTPASEHQSEDDCPQCGQLMWLHPRLRSAQKAHQIRSDAHFESYLRALRTVKESHPHATYICRNTACPSYERPMW